jgi:hypothetical protein
MVRSNGFPSGTASVLLSSSWISAPSEFISLSNVARIATYFLCSARTTFCASLTTFWYSSVMAAAWAATSRGGDRSQQRYKR